MLQCAAIDNQATVAYFIGQKLMLYFRSEAACAQSSAGNIYLSGIHWETHFMRTLVSGVCFPNCISACILWEKGVGLDPNLDQYI